MINCRKIWEVKGSITPSFIIQPIYPQCIFSTKEHLLFNHCSTSWDRYSIQESLLSLIIHLIDRVAAHKVEDWFQGLLKEIQKHSIGISQLYHMPSFYAQIGLLRKLKNQREKTNLIFKRNI